jgi:NADH:ubiquinone oxidoreductase subunit D
LFGAISRNNAMRQSNHIIKQCVDWLRENPGSVMSDDKEVAPPKRTEMKDDMESLIHQNHNFYLSISPKTISCVPIMVTTSDNICPFAISSMAAKCANPGARIFTR